MTSVQFSTNAGQVAKGVPKSLLRVSGCGFTVVVLLLLLLLFICIQSLYDEIKKIPLQWAQ